MKECIWCSGEDNECACNYGGDTSETIFWKDISPEIKVKHNKHGFRKYLLTFGNNGKNN